MLIVDGEVSEARPGAFELVTSCSRLGATRLDPCAVNVPLPLDGHALPAELQVMCPPGEEERLLRVASGPKLYWDGASAISGGESPVSV